MKNPRGIGRVLVLLLGGSSAALRAGGPPGPLPIPEADFRATPPEADFPTPRYGVQLYGARPQIDLRLMTTRTGQGLGLFMEERLTPTAVLQTRIDYVNYAEQDFEAPVMGPMLPAPVTSLSANAASIGADLRRYLPYPGLRTVYVLAGMSAVRYEFRTLSTPAPTLDENGLPLPSAPVEAKAKTSVKWGLAVGLGWELHPGYALTARYTYAAVSSINLAALELGLRASF